MNLPHSIRGSVKLVTETLNLTLHREVNQFCICLVAWFALGAPLTHAAEGPRYSSAPVGRPAEISKKGASAVDLLVTINGQVLCASLLDVASARDFLALLPLTLDLEDYADTEKIAQLPRKLSTAGTPAGMTPSVGDITYYAPWGNLAIFYRDAGYARGLVKLGRLEGNVRVLGARGSLKARIEVAGKQ